MTPPIDSPLRPTPRGSASFDSSCDTAFVAYGHYKESARYAVDIGLGVLDIHRYVDGTLPVGERADVQSLIAKSPWAMRRVAALVKERRGHP
jgi:hypothetical protein